MKDKGDVLLKNKLFCILCFCVLMFSNLNSVVSQSLGSSTNEKNKITALQEPDQPKFALLVGITNYKNKDINKIDGCENNVQLLEETLVKKYGFENNNVATLVNEKATKDEIKKMFRLHLIENARKAKEQKKEAVIVYYFCGHGSQYPDQDEEENDSLDETFVAYDSRTDDVFDILDDEIDDLKAELRFFTNNTTLILESCHSGSSTRGDKEYVAEEISQDERKRSPYKRSFPRTKEEEAFTYTELAASLSIRSALSETKEGCQCEKPYSLMTKALVEELNIATDKTTYRGLMRNVASRVAEKSLQEPQVEGNRDTLLFGGAAKRAKPYIEIEKILPNNQIIIRAGKVHGLRVGSQVSIYSSESTTNTGKEFWMTNGQVSKVRDFFSEVNLPKPEENSKVKEIKITSHVVLTAPVFGGGSLLIALNSSENRNISQNEKTLHSEIKKRLEEEGMIETKLVKVLDTDIISRAEKDEAKGIIRLKKSRISVIFPQTTDINLPTSTCDGNRLVESKMPLGETEVYYLDDGDLGGKPLFGLFFKTDESDLADKIFTTIRNFALQTNLRSLDNAASSLSSNLKVSWQIISGKFTETCVGGQKKPSFKAEKSIDVKDNKIPVGEFYQLKIKNISGEIRKKKDEFASGEPYCITALFLKSDGEIRVIYPRIGVNDALADDKELDTKTLFRATYPLGVERLIVIISKPINNLCPDYSFYQTRGTKSPKSILDQIITQSGVKSRDTNTYITDEPDQWGVVNIDVNVVKNSLKK